METEATMPRTTSSRGRLMATLFAAQVCGSTGHSIGMAVGSIMAAGITGTNTWSGLPDSVGAIGLAVSLHLGGMYVTSPLSGWLSDRFGRVPSIAAGAVVLIGAVMLAG